MPGTARLGEQLRGALERALRELLDQVLLGREVVVERLLGDVGGLGDLERGGGREALAPEQPGRGLDDPLVDLAAPALAPARRRIRDRRRHGQFSGTVGGVIEPERARKSVSCNPTAHGIMRRTAAEVQR